MPRTLGGVPDTVPGLLRALGQRIREMRLAQGYSQESFADKCGVHRTFMGTVERGESNLSFRNVVKMAETLGVSLAVLFTDLESSAREADSAPAKHKKATDD